MGLSCLSKTQPCQFSSVIRRSVRVFTFVLRVCFDETLSANVLQMQRHEMCNRQVETKRAISIKDNDMKRQPFRHHVKQSLRSFTTGISYSSSCHSYSLAVCCTCYKMLQLLLAKAATGAADKTNGRKRKRICKLSRERSRRR